MVLTHSVLKIQQNRIVTGGREWGFLRWTLYRLEWNSLPKAQSSSI